MRKILLAIFLSTISAFMLCACDHVHVYGEWEIFKDATYVQEGEERRFCEKCGDFESRPTEKKEYPYYITLSVFGVESKIGVEENGEYSLDAPLLDGYEFIRFVDGAGQEFSQSGVINSSISVYAEMSVAETKDFQTLKRRIEKGVADVKIASDIEITETIYVYNDLNISSTDKFVINRSTDFLGDLFVIGENANGDNPILENRKVTVKIETENSGELTFDGNKLAVEGSVFGSAFYLTNSSILEIYDGVTIKNFKKTSNKKLVDDFGDIWDSANEAGGSAVMIAYGVLNMYGGLITDNECVTDTSLTDSIYGGAIYNRSSMNMYGGTIANNSAVRGGAIYCYRTTNILCGEINNNHATTYGGAIYMPNSQYTTLIIGDSDDLTSVTFNGNNSLKSGGAIFGQTLTNFVIYEGTSFIGNYNADGNGGAINTSGPILANGVNFTSNVAEGKGGAVYITYKHPENKVRISEFNACVFDGNSAEYGGAITLYSEDKTYEQGAVGYFNDCKFTENQATTNGGAIYAGRSAEVNLYDSEFELNKSKNTEYGGGAIYFTASKGSFEKVSFIQNSADYNGGAVAVYSSSELAIKGILLDGNTAKKYGGGLYVNKSTLTVKEDGKNTVKNNSASNGGGAYFTNAEVNIDNIKFEENSATGNGGGVYVYTDSVVEISSLTMTGNTAEGYGGGIYASGASSTVVKEVNANANVAEMGGFLYITTKNTEFVLFEGNVTGNIATENDGGNAIWSNSSGAIIRFDGGVDTQKVIYNSVDVQGKSSIMDIERGE